MAFCEKCGAQMEDTAKFCPACGAGTEEKAQANKTVNFEDILNKCLATEDVTADFDKEDIEKNKVMSLFSYIWILFLIPLLGASDSKFARFHANQGLVLFLISLCIGVVGAIFSWIPVLSVIVWIICSLAGLAELALMIYGIINACTGKAIKLPLIGEINILK